MLGPQAPLPKTIEEKAVVGAIILPELNVIEWGCAVLSKLTESMKSVIAKKECKLLRENDALVRAFAEATDKDLVALQTQMNNIKCFR